MKLVQIKDVPLLRVGTFSLSSGRAEFTEEDLDAAIEAQSDEAVRPIRIGPGHHSAHDGTPAFGIVDSLKRVGDTLMGTLNVPEKLAAIIKTAWPSRSIEGRRNVVTSTGHTHRLVIDRLALLGMERPGVDSLADLHELMAALDERSGEEFRVEASAYTDDPKEDHMDLDALRGELGLPEDATEEQIKEAIAKLKAQATESPAGEAKTDGAPTGESEAPAPKPEAEVETPKAEAETKEPVAAKADDGTVRVTKEAWEAVQEELAEAREDRQRREQERRRAVVAKAIDEGKIVKDAEADWLRRMDKSPETTEEIIASLAPSMPVDGERGYRGTEGNSTGRFDPFAGTGSITNIDPEKLVASGSDEDPLALPDDEMFSPAQRRKMAEARKAITS